MNERENVSFKYFQAVDILTNINWSVIYVKFTDVQKTNTSVHPLDAIKALGVGVKG